MNSAYLIEIGDKKIVCMDESLLNKCRERLSKRFSNETSYTISPVKVKICSSEKDLDILLSDDEEEALATVTYNGWGTETHM